MKTLLTTISALALLLIVTPALAKSDGHKLEKNRSNWSPEIRERFQAARTKALEDPEIKKLQTEARAANEKFFQSMRKKMSEIDPGLTEIARQKRDEKGNRPNPESGTKKSNDPNAKDHSSSSRNDRPGIPKSHRSGWNSLDDSERQSLKAARKKVESDPVIQAALEKKQAASATYRQTMREAMLKADPSIEPILKKIFLQPLASASDPDKKPEMDGETME